MKNEAFIAGLVDGLEKRGYIQLLTKIPAAVKAIQTGIKAVRGLQTASQGMQTVNRIANVTNRVTDVSNLVNAKLKHFNPPQAGNNIETPSN